MACLWLVLVVVVDSVYLLKVTCRKKGPLASGTCLLRTTTTRDVPATREKLDVEGMTLGKTSGIDTAASIASLDGTLENEWT